jgi:MYXO-CTERM domain-containing protein
MTAALLIVPINSYATMESFPDFSNTAGLTLSGTAVTAVVSDGTASEAGVTSDGSLASDGSVASDASVGSDGSVASDASVGSDGPMAFDGSVDSDGSVAANRTVLRLTQATMTESGSVFASNTINAADFSTVFTFRLTNPGGAPDPNGHRGGDGIAFAIQPISASLGGSGQGLGIGGISPSVAIEFDTWYNSPTDYPLVSDPSSNHIGVDIDGDTHSVVTTDVSPPFDDGNVWHVWIDYDGVTLTVSAGETDVRPPMPQLSYVINIPNIIGANTAFVGFTGATGGSFQDQDILSWTYFDHYVDGGLPGGGDTGAGDAPDAGGEGGGAGQDATVDSPENGGTDASAVSDGTVDGSGGGSVDGSGGGGEASTSTQGSRSGCGCVVGAASGSGGAAAPALLLLLVHRHRRRRVSLRT